MTAAIGNAHRFSALGLDERKKTKKTRHVIRCSSMRYPPVLSQLRHVTQGAYAAGMIRQALPRHRLALLATS